MPRVVLFAVLALLLNPAGAVICKQVDAQGVVSYSDLPADECPQPVQLPDYSRYSPPPIKAPGPPATPVTVRRQGDAEQAFAGYTEMRIEQPAEGASVWNNEGKVPVAIFLSPNLQPGHKVQLLLDGKNAGPPFGSLAATLANVARGTHRLSARLLDEAGNVLREAGPVTFTLHRASVKRPKRGEDGDGSDSGTGDGNGSGSSPFAPIPATPGKTNPAFKPNYNTQGN